MQDARAGRYGPCMGTRCTTMLAHVVSYMCCCCCRQPGILIQQHKLAVCLRWRNPKSALPLDPGKGPRGAPFLPKDWRLPVGLSYSLSCFFMRCFHCTLFSCGLPLMCKGRATCEHLCSMMGVMLCLGMLLWNLGDTEGCIMHYRTGRKGLCRHMLAGMQIRLRC